MLPIFRKVLMRFDGGVIHLKPKGKPRGDVLVSYTTFPFIYPNKLNAHSNRFECREIAQSFLDREYAVDVIDSPNDSFIPKKKYKYIIDIGPNLERLKPIVGKECIKIFHITGAHWSFQNHAEHSRIADIEKRRGVLISPRRQQKVMHAIETCDIATLLGNEFTESTYLFAGKKIIRIPISTTHTFPSPENKDFDRIRKNFIWLGGSGMVHKGLDLVLEAFVDMPDFHLTVFGKKDDDFAKVYEKELFNTPNIHYGGHVDLGSKEFSKTVNSAIGTVFPSASEGGGGSVIECMHAGLIPIVSREASVDVNDFGVILTDNSVAEIKKQVRTIASLPIETLKTRSLGAWKFANEKHTRETFSNAWRKFVSSIDKN